MQSTTSFIVWMSIKATTKPLYIYPPLHKLPTTQKSVAYTIVNSGTANDVDSSCHICMDTRHAAPQLLVLMQTNHNIERAGIYKANTVGF